MSVRVTNITLDPVLGGVWIYFEGDREGKLWIDVDDGVKFLGEGVDGPAGVREVISAALDFVADRDPDGAPDQEYILYPRVGWTWSDVEEFLRRAARSLTIEERMGVRA